MTTVVIGNDIITDTDELDDFNETHKIKLYKKAIAKGQRYQKELDKIFSKEKEKAEDFLEVKISEVLNDLAKITRCRIAKTTLKIIPELSRENPGEKDYRAEVFLTLKSEF